MVDRLDVRIGRDRVGTLERTANGLLRFAYDEDWLERADATPLSVSMPLRSGAFEHDTVHPYLWGLLPDNEAVVDRWARTYQCSPSNVFALLANVGTDVAGAAQYLLPGAASEEAAEATYEWLTDGEVADLLREVGEDVTAWHPLHDQGRWSLAGAQAKIALAHDPQRGWAIPGGRAPTTHILKPAIARLKDHDLNELLCIRAASKLGLVTEEAELGHFGDQRALVVKRYDRLPGDDGQIVRLHQEDLCQALGVHPNRKYQSDGGPSAIDVLQVLRDNSTAVTTDVRRLVDALAYHWLILGTDAHAKNYSLLLSGQQVRLAPLYDLASLAPYVSYAPKAKLAQKVGGEYRAGKISDGHWVKLARAARIDPPELLERITELAAQLPLAFDAALEDLALEGRELDAASELIASVLGWSSVAVQQLDAPRWTDRGGLQPAEAPRPAVRHARGTPLGGRFAPRPQAEAEDRLGDDET